MLLAGEYARPRLRELQRFMWAICVLGEMTYAGVDMGCQLDVVRRRRKTKRSTTAVVGSDLRAM